jgi:hypothetical protein
MEGRKLPGTADVVHEMNVKVGAIIEGMKSSSPGTARPKSSAEAVQKITELDIDVLRSRSLVLKDKHHGGQTSFEDEDQK